MTEIQPFGNGEFEVEFIPDGDSFKVIASGVAKSLGHREASDLVHSIPPDEKGSELVRTPGGQQAVWILKEPGFYRAIGQRQAARVRDDGIRSQVERFQKWIYGEVLPALRRTGSYNATAIPDMTTARGRLQILDMATKAEQRALAAEERANAAEVDASRARQTLDAHGLSLVRNVAKRFGIKEKTLREFLYGEKLLIRGGSSHNEPYARHVQAGHFEVKTSLIEMDPDRPAEAKSTTYVTPRGEALIWRRLHAAGLVSTPVMPGEQLAIAEGA
jgi:anti-repressor protein